MWKGYLIILHILEICLEIKIIFQIFPDIQIRSGCRRILAVVLLAGVLYSQIVQGFTCFISCGNLLLTAVLIGLICLLMVKKNRLGIFVLFWFCNVSIELLKLPCLVFEGGFYQKTLYRINYGNRIWIEAIWCSLIFFGIFLLAYIKKESSLNIRKLLTKHGAILWGLGTAEWVLLFVIMQLGAKKAFSANVILIAFLGIFCAFLLFLYLVLNIVWREAENEKNLMALSQELLLQHHKELNEAYIKNNQRIHDTKHIALYLKNCIMVQIPAHLTMYSAMN